MHKFYYLIILFFTVVSYSQIKEVDIDNYRIKKRGTTIEILFQNDSIPIKYKRGLNYINGKLHYKKNPFSGTVFYYHSNNNLESKSEYIQGFKDGNQLVYNELGKPILESFELVGFSIKTTMYSYDESGVLTEKSVMTVDANFMNKLNKFRYKLLADEISRQEFEKLREEYYKKGFIISSEQIIKSNNSN